MDPVIFLFDVDGVLVRPGGYRAATSATVNYFTRQLGLGDIAPKDETLGIFEAQGITCEWDMVPLILAAVLEEAVRTAPNPPAALDSFQQAVDWLRGAELTALAIDYAPIFRRLGSYVRPGEAPSDSVLSACRADADADAAPFPRLAGQGVLEDILCKTRQLGHSTTRVFEAYALGDVVFTQTSGLPADIQSDSLLARHDQPLLAKDTRDSLVSLRQQGRLAFSAYTARPSLPVGKPPELLAMYVPEAEMALAQLGIDPFPLVGSGQTGELAWELGLDEDSLVKPSPYHAVAAIATAWNTDRRAALDWAAAVYRHLEQGAAVQPSTGNLPRQLNLHIFEDSPAGMRGGKHAAQLLASLGMQIQLHLWGVSGHAEKAAALRAVGARVSEDVNQAVRAALEAEGLA